MIRRRALLTTARAHHAIGDAIWVEYDMRIVLGSQIINARGTALCEKSGGRWRIVHMNHSAPPTDHVEAKSANRVKPCHRIKMMAMTARKLKRLLSIYAAISGSRCARHTHC